MNERKPPLLDIETLNAVAARFHDRADEITQVRPASRHPRRGTGAAGDGRNQ